MHPLIATIHKLREYLGYLVAVYFVFPRLWVSYLIALWGLMCFIIIFVDGRKFKKINLLNTCLFSLPFFLIIFSIFAHQGDGNSIIEKSLSFIIFPVSIFLSGYRLENDKLTNYAKVFVLGCVVLTAKAFIMYLVVVPTFPYNTMHDFFFRYRNEFNSNTQISPTYASIYLGFAIISMILLPIKPLKNGWLFWSFGAIIVLNMFVLSAKMPMIALLVVLLIFLVRKDIKFNIKTGRAKILWTILVVTGISCLFVFTRWNELISMFHYNPLSPQENSAGIRAEVYQCDLQLSKKYFLFGTGPQNIQQKLNQCYYQFEGNDFDRHEFNTHNQYLDYLISSGVVGLFILLGFIIRPIWLAIRRKDSLLLGFTVLIAISMLTENLLSRQAGIVFICFFMSLLVNRKEKEETFS